MAALVLRDNLQPCSSGESKRGNKWILEPNAIYIVIARLVNDFSRDLVAAKERLENGGFDLLVGFDFAWCPSPPALCRRFNIIPNEPAAKPARSNFLNRSPLPTLQRGRDCGQINFVGEAQMLWTLADAPNLWLRPPVELFG